MTNKYNPEHIDGIVTGSAINENLDAIQEALKSSLSREPESGNQMMDDLDLNSFRVINLRDAQQSQDAVPYGQMKGILESINISDHYLGAFYNPPTKRNSGAPLQRGDLYFNLTDNSLDAYDGSSWVKDTTISHAQEYAELSEEWATKLNSKVDGEDYSSKQYAKNARAGESSAKTSASLAESARDQAKDYRNDAKEYRDDIVNSSAWSNADIYETKADGISGTSNKDFFWVIPNATDDLDNFTLFKNNSGTADKIYTLYNLNAFMIEEGTTWS